MEKTIQSDLQKMTIATSLAIYLTAALMMIVGTRYLIPLLCRLTGMETVVAWFTVASLIVFLPLLFLAYWILKKESAPLTPATWVKRLRFRRLTRHDLTWALIGLVGVSLLCPLLMKGIVLFFGEFDHSPPFMAFEPLTAGRYWILALWIPYWILNIMGEEILWRGVMLPRQEAALGKWAWLFHGFGWGLFHIAFGWQLLVVLLPLLFIQSYVVQKTKNSWVGVLMHGVVNGPSFIAIALGVM